MCSSFGAYIQTLVEKPKLNAGDDLQKSCTFSWLMFYNVERDRNDDKVKCVVFPLENEKKRFKYLEKVINHGAHGHIL